LLYIVLHGHNDKRIPAQHGLKDKIRVASVEPNVAKVLVAEDDPDILSNVLDFLKSEKYTVDSVKTGSDALEHLKFYEYDVVILDWNMPGITGVNVCAQYRAAGGKTPILMLTGRDKVVEKAEGLDAGADDYLTKPFDMIELSARLRALLRRPKNVQENLLKFGPVAMNTVAREVTVSGNAIVLLPLEYALLEFLMRYPNQVFSHSVLVERVWKSESIATAESVRTCVMSLRKKITVPGQPSIVKTVHGLGYKLQEPTEK